MTYQSGGALTITKLVADACADYQMTQSMKIVRHITMIPLK